MNYDKGFLGNTIVSAEKYHIQWFFFKTKNNQDHLRILDSVSTDGIMEKAQDDKTWKEIMFI